MSPAAAYDIVFIADVRFEGGSSTALAAEIRAAAMAGLRTGLLAVKGPLLGHPFPMHPELRALVEGGATERLDPDVPIDCDLVLLHHPTIIENRFTTPVRIRAEHVAVVLHHPVHDRRGKVQYDLERVVAHCHAAFGRPVMLAPVSPVVRYSLPRILPEKCCILVEDWDNLIDLDDWPVRLPRPPHHPIAIGRHSRPHAQKWPNTLREAQLVYPTDGSLYTIRILGGGPYLEEHYGAPLPANWENMPFSWTGVRDFLAELDFYVYFHGAEWSEAFGRTILEALATGLVVILPAHFEPLFGEAALYAAPSEVRQLIGRLASDPEAYLRQGALARDFAERRHSTALFGPRLQRLFGMPRPREATARPALVEPLPVRRVLFASTNGVGVGHLTQQFAIAQRLPPSLKPVFATMSYAMKTATDQGYHSHFLTYHRSIGADPVRWNKVLAEELFDLIRYLRPSVFAYDATAVFGGVVEALAAVPDLYSIWVRRPMWREVHRRFLELSHRFDAVIEPGELADAFDNGPTKAERGNVLLVPPVLMLSPAERVERAAARRFLGIEDGVTAVALQLGAGSNFDMAPARRAAIEAILARDDTLVLDLRSPIRAAFEPEESFGPRHRMVELFPSFRYSRAFDVAVAAPGYNTFHENVLGAIPTLFVPNEAEEMDLQLNRARYAELSGLGLLMRRDHDVARVDGLIERLLDPAERSAIAARCSDIAWTNGADDIVRFIEDHARILRTDRDITRDE